MAKELSDCEGYLMVNLPVLVRVLGDMLRRIFGFKLYPFRTLDEALDYARRKLAGTR